ncbi:MAG: hypothetical protein V4479_12330 [Actinomycetota bacterium]
MRKMLYIQTSDRDAKNPFEAQVRSFIEALVSGATIYALLALIPPTSPHPAAWAAGAFAISYAGNLFWRRYRAREKARETAEAAKDSAME